VINIAAIADVHFGEDSRGTLRPHLEGLEERADVLLIAGDFTRHGHAHEAAIFADEVKEIGIPIFAVLGNHDYHSNEEKEIRDVLEEVGVRVLEGEGADVAVNGTSLGIAGIKGFGGGFAGASGTEFGEPEMKAFIRHTCQAADALRESLHDLKSEHRVALLHYSPVEGTLQGERLEIYPFLGSYLLAEAVDEAGADLIVHGHAHAGSEKGVTPGGVHVRNVAQPLIKKPYNLYCIGAEADPAC
jgi:Icc-related predicted phosphoesterase